MRNLLVARVCGADSDLIAATPDQRPGLAKAAALFSEEDLTRYFQILLNTDDDLRRKPDPRVHLEMGLLRLVNAARLAPLEELLSGARGNGSSGAGTGGSGSGTKTAAASTSYTSRMTTTPSLGTIARSDTSSPPPRKKLHPPLWQVRFASPTTQAARQPPRHRRLVRSCILPWPFPDTTVPIEESGNGNSSVADGLSLSEVTEIKAAIQAQQKFIGEFLEYASRWELDGTELRIYFPSNKSAFAGLVEVRETLEKIRNAASNVLGRAVRVCARLDSSAASDTNSSRVAANTDNLRAKFEEDPLVKSMLQRFGGKISEVRRQEE